MRYEFELLDQRGEKNIRTVKPYFAKVKRNFKT